MTRYPFYFRLILLACILALGHPDGLPSPPLAPHSFSCDRGNICLGNGPDVPA